MGSEPMDSRDQFLRGLKDAPALACKIVRRGPAESELLDSILKPLFAEHGRNLDHGDVAGLGKALGEGDHAKFVKSLIRCRRG